MKEHKYRVWDKTEKRMFRVLKLEFDTDYPDKLYEVHTYPIRVYRARPYKFKGRSIEEIIIIEFTGLKDKNGKEIYEGDILGFARGKHFAAEVLPLNPFKGFYMKWKKGCARIRYTEDGTEPIWGNHTISLEIIGNIYESKHLLDK